MIGKIRTLVSSKGFGFIESGKVRDYFFHMSDCKTDFIELREGDNVEFDLVESKKGPRACDVRKV